MKRIIILVALMLAAVSAGAQTTISQVYVSASTGTTATITWTTSTPTTSQVKYDTSSALQYSTAQTTTFTTSHSVQLILLSSSYLYYFAPVSMDSGGHTTQGSTLNFSLCGSPFVPVTGTVNNYYQYGTYTMTWVPPTGVAGTPTVCGQPMPTTVTGSLSGGGTFSASVGDSYKAIPGPGSWQITVADVGGLSPVTTTYPVSAQNSDVSQQLQALTPAAGLTAVIANTVGHTVYPGFICTTYSGCGGGTTTNPLTGAASGGAAPGSTFNGSAPVTFDYHTLGAGGLAASNTWSGTNAFTGTTTVPTQSPGTNNTTVANTAFVAAAVAADGAVLQAPTMAQRVASYALTIDLPQLFPPGGYSGEKDLNIYDTTGTLFPLIQWNPSWNSGTVINGRTTLQLNGAPGYGTCLGQWNVGYGTSNCWLSVDAFGQAIQTPAQSSYLPMIAKQGQDNGVYTDVFDAELHDGTKVLQVGALGSTSAAGGYVKVNGPLDASTSQTSIWTLGDSLTSGYEGQGLNPTTALPNAGSWPTVLQSGIVGNGVYSPGLGVATINAGVGGNTSTQICVRQGGCATSTVNNITIPACASLPCSSGVTVVFPTGSEPVTSLGPAGGTAGSFSGINGNVTLSGSTYTFTPTQICSSTAVVAGTRFYVAEPYYSNPQIYEAGINDQYPWTNVAANVAAMVANRPKWQNFGVVDLMDINQPNYWIGGSYRSALIGVNNTLASTYGTSGYVQDANGNGIRAVLANATCALPWPNDVAACTNGIIGMDFRSVQVPSGTATLNTSINSTATTIIVNKAASSPNCCFNAGQILTLEPDTANAEDMPITASTDTAGATTATLTVTRGGGYSPAISHTSGVVAMGTETLHLNGPLGYALQAATTAAWIGRNWNNVEPATQVLANQQYPSFKSVTAQAVTAENAQIANLAPCTVQNLVQATTGQWSFNTSFPVSQGTTIQAIQSFGCNVTIATTGLNASDLCHGIFQLTGTGTNTTAYATCFNGVQNSFGGQANYYVSVNQPLGSESWTLVYSANSNIFSTNALGFSARVSTDPDYLVAVKSTNSGATNGITAGQVCNINQSYTGSSPYYEQVAFCEGGSGDIYLYSSNFTALGSSNFTLIGHFTNAGNLIVPGTVAGTNIGISNAITSATGGSGTGTVTCLTAACTNLAGTYSVVGGTFTTGTFLTLVWPTTTTAYDCTVVMNGGSGFLGLGHGVATATGMTVTAAVSILGLTVTFDYRCGPN